MLDLGNLPAIPPAIFIGSSPAGTLGDTWNSWHRPRGIKMVYILCIGAGAGGGGGFTRAAGNAGGGGGSGGSSSIARLLIPADCLPDTIYIYTPSGGLGVGSGGGTAGAGLAAMVANYPSNFGAIISNTILISGGGNATGGGTGTGAAVGGAGGSANVAAITDCPLAGMGIPAFIVGQAGRAGGAVAGAVGVNGVIPVTGLLTSGGAGGAGTTAADFAGGGFTAISNGNISSIRPIAPAAGSFNGCDGPALWSPGNTMFFFGGCGGSSSNAGVGGAGGRGAIGAGGGGGGAGTTGGRGGDGGPGMVMITCW